jgi:hypothetical protein
MVPRYCPASRLTERSIILKFTCQSLNGKNESASSVDRVRERAPVTPRRQYRSERTSLPAGFRLSTEGAEWD